MHIIKLVRAPNCQGFTLIELLVTIIIVGVLSAIALPGFLNQVSKARGSEAKNTLGAINRAQQAYRLQNISFAGQLSKLDVKVGGKFYSYKIDAADAQNASALTPSAASNDLKLYSSGITQIGDFSGQVICESLTDNTPAGAATAPIIAGQSGSCAPGAKLIE